MWNWLTTHSFWVLLCSSLALAVVIFAAPALRRRLARHAPRLLQTRLSRAGHSIVWVLKIVLLAGVVLGAVALVASRQGAAAAITPESIQAWVEEHGPVVALAIVTSYLAYRALVSLLPPLVERTVRARGRGRRAREEMAKRASTLSSIFTGVAAVLVVTVALFSILSELGIDIAPLLAGAGVVGLAVGFGAQNLIRDLISGLFVLIEDQYNKGDVVKVAGLIGLVEEVNLRRTVMRDLDGIVHSIPNGEITTSSNYTKEWSRVNLDVPVAYGEDLDHVFAVINRVGSELAADAAWASKIRQAPQVLRVNNFGDSGIEIKVLGETKPLMQWEVTGELRKRLKKAFDEENIEIPWPHVKLYYGNAPLSGGPPSQERNSDGEQ
ncbi:MAG: mechanosensitive ion channel family protein [Chloroflexota bacterium]